MARGEGGGNKSSYKAGFGKDVIIILLEEDDMAADGFEACVSVVGVSMRALRVCLCELGFERPPGVEAAAEAVRLVSFPHQTQLPGWLRLLRAHVLDVNLQGGGVSEMRMTAEPFHYRWGPKLASLSGSKYI